MRKLVSVVVCCLGFAFLLSAQDDAELSKSMKSLPKAMGVLRDNKVGPDAAASAEIIQQVFASTESFWEKKGTTDALKWTQEAKAAAGDLAVAAKAGDAEKAGAAFKTVAGSCRSCHEAHREKAADGSYKIK